MKKLHHYDIAVNGTFTFGADGDDKDIFKRTVEEVIKMKVDLPRYSILTPFPKTKLYNDLEKQGRIFSKKLDNVRCSARCIPSKKNDCPGTSGRWNLRLEGNL